MTIRINTLKPGKNGRRFADDTFKRIFLNENIGISIIISLTFNNIPALVQMMAWRRPGDKPLFEPMVVWLSTHICVTQPQWVKHNHTPIRCGYFSRCWQYSKWSRHHRFSTKCCALPHTIGLSRLFLKSSSCVLDWITFVWWLRMFFNTY